MVRGFLVASVAAAFVAVAPSAFAAKARSTHVSRGTVELTMNVIFDYQGDITVALADGTPVGTTSGSPTVIPAGYYSVILTGPGLVHARAVLPAERPGRRGERQHGAGRGGLHGVRRRLPAELDLHVEERRQPERRLHVPDLRSRCVGTKAPPVDLEGPRDNEVGEQGHRRQRSPADARHPHGDRDRRRREADAC